MRATPSDPPPCREAAPILCGPLEGPSAVHPCVPPPSISPVCQIGGARHLPLLTLGAGSFAHVSRARRFGEMAAAVVLREYGRVRSARAPGAILSACEPLQRLDTRAH